MSEQTDEQPPMGIGYCSLCNTEYVARGLNDHGPGICALDTSISPSKEGVDGAGAGAAQVSVEAQALADELEEALDDYCRGHPDSGKDLASLVNRNNLAILSALRSAKAAPYGIRCDACGHTMAKHDRMAHCPPKDDLTKEGWPPVVWVGCTLQDKLTVYDEDVDQCVPYVRRDVVENTARNTARNAAFPHCQEHDRPTSGCVSCARAADKAAPAVPETRPVGESPDPLMQAIESAECAHPAAQDAIAKEQK